MSGLGWLEYGVEGWFPELEGGRVGLIRLNLQLVAWGRGLCPPEALGSLS